MTRPPHPSGSRRWQAALIVALFLAAVAGAAFAGWWYARESPPHQGPIVLISVDGLRADRLSAYGAPPGDTPSIDALAADAVVFERAYSHSPLTLPAHASLLAGQLPFEHGVRDDAGFALRADTRPLAELLRNRGFETGAAVSSFVLRRESGLARGFSFFDADLPEAKEAPAPVVERDGALTMDVAERWLRTRRGQRVFLFVQVNDPAADTTVARLVRQLEALDLYDQATIVLTADVGEAGWGVALDEAALRVPLLVKQPGQGAGRRIRTPVQHIDILPTVLDVVRAPIPSGLRGRSLRDLLDGKSPDLPPRPIYAESLAARFRLGGYGAFAVGSGEYRYVRGSGEALLDLEEGTVSSPPPDLPAATELREALDRLLEGREVDPPADIREADEDQYAALGYLDGGAVAAGEPAPIDPDDEASLMAAHREAALLAGQKRYTAAIDRLRAIGRRHPEMTVIHYQLGMLLARTGRLGDATAALREAASLQPDNPLLRVALATVALRGGELDEARAHAGLAVALAERRDARARAVAHETAARVALARKDAQAAQAHAEAAQAEDAAIPMPQFVRGRLLYDEGRYAEALEAFDDANALAMQHERAFEELHWYLGDTLARLDRYEEAEAHFREEVRAFPRRLRSYASLATLYRASNREQGIEEIVSALMEAAPTPEGYATAARLWTILGDRGRADAIRADARTRFRGDPSLALLGR
ncbi:MAG: sulfatase-like hydrolase/transferase [Acidobacteria bacterium]|nr:sulfatase-like hydrolase/transferase [Acidobacteriota bacterium]